MNRNAGPSPQAKALSKAERLARLRLIRTPHVGPITFHQLIARFGTGIAALEALPDLARRGGRTKPLKVCPQSVAERELAALAKIGAQALFHGGPGYPPPLAACEDAPPVLFTLGHVHLLEKPAIAVVGARNASAVGVRFAREIAGALGARGLIVVSGLARGIDAAAHEGALSSGTIAVQAGGIDVIYPSENTELYGKIREVGLLVSEIPPGVQPQARHFPRRNRLISGLALGVLVVEAAPRSGSLITARLALEQGREVFAVPGSPLDPRARGANNLIRQGATLTESADDVLAVLEETLRTPLKEPRGHAMRHPVARPPSDAELDAGRRRIAAVLSPTPIGIDELIRQCELTPAVVLTILLELELAGRLDRHPGNRVSLL